MEHLSPSLSLLFSVRRSIEMGFSVRKGIDEWLELARDEEFRPFVVRWRIHLERGNQLSEKDWASVGPWRRNLLEALGRGLRGESIGKTLESLEAEMLRAAEEELQVKLSKLPYLAMIPTLLFQLPAFLLLLFGPLVRNFLHSLGG